MEPLQSCSPAVNALGRSPLHGLVAAAGEDGMLQCFDMRQRKAIGQLDAAAACGAEGR
jgi:ribosome biogenesis protein ENP2